MSLRTTAGRLLRRARPDAPLCDDVDAWARARGLTSVELFPERTIERKPPSTVEPQLHEEYTSRLQATQRRSYLVPISGARIVGDKATVVLPDGSYAVEPSYTPEHLVSEPAYHSPPLRRPVAKQGNYFILTSRWSNDNYYHWFHDSLSRLYRTRDLLPPDTKFVVPDPLLTFQRESLVAMGLADRLVPFRGDEAWELETLYFAPPPTNSGSSRGDIYRYVVRAITDGLGSAPPNPTRRLYLSRPSSSARTVINEPEVVSLLREHDFEAVVPESFTFRDEVELFRSAAVVVAPHGAGLTNTLFAPPGCTVVDVIPDHKISWGYTYWTMGVELGHDYWYFFADSVAHDRPGEPDMRIPIDKLAATLANALL